MRQYQYRVESHLKRPRVDYRRRRRRRGGRGVADVAVVITIISIVSVIHRAPPLATTRTTTNIFIVVVAIAIVDPIRQSSGQRGHVARMRERMEQPYRGRPPVVARIPC